MQVSDKLIKPVMEVKYLSADNADRYRCIMRIFFENYEKLKYRLYQEDVYEEMLKDSFFADYRPEQGSYVRWLGKHNQPTALRHSGGKGRRIRARIPARKTARVTSQ